MERLAFLLQPLLLLALSLLFGCGKGFDDREIEGTLTMNGYKGWRELEIRSDAIDSDKQAYTKFVKPGKKMIEIEPGSKFANITIMTVGRIPIAKYKIPADSFDEKANSFFATSYELKQQYNLGGGRVKRILRKETVDKDGAKKCVVQSCYKDYDAKQKKWVDRPCDGLKGNVWYVENTRYDYVLNFTILDPKDPRNLIAQFVGMGEEKLESKEYSDSVCRPRLKMYAKDGKLDPTLTQMEWKAVIK